MKRTEKFSFRIGIPTIVALVLAAALLLVFATPLSFGVYVDSSDFESLTMYSCKVEGESATFELPDASFFENTTVTFTGLTEDEKLLKDISQVEIKNNCGLFNIAGTNVRITDSTAYIIVTGYRQLLVAGSMESYGFAVHLTK